ncbi:Cytochrome P450 [Tylopilus felleus]
MAAPWLTYAKWAKVYGDIIYSRLLGNDIIIINSEKVARELLERRSLNYSDRPYLITNELCGTDFNTVLLPYGDSWRLHREFFHRTFRSEVVSRFRPLQFRKSCELLQQLLAAPDRFSGHVFEYTASVIMNSVYDYDPSSQHDESTALVANVIDVASSAIQPEVALVVGAFPALLHLPSWFPGMSFHKKMAASKRFMGQYVERLFERSLQRLPDGGSAPSMIRDSIENAGLGDGVTPDASEAWMIELKNAAATGFLGSNSVIMTFFLMMVLNPAVQEKAQAEIDLVLGGDRLPTIDDRPSLPYIDAILREVYRYNPVLPLSIPHVAVDDDVYSGFHIPKGSLLLSNLWSIAHDETKYPDPEKFFPERFLAEDGSITPNDVEHLAFGFGRRICPGRHFADASVWSVIANVLAVFSISKSKDANGVEIPVEPKFSSGITIHPLPFACDIAPRKPTIDAEKLEQLIAATPSLEH